MSLNSSIKKLEENIVKKGNNNVRKINNFSNVRWLSRQRAFSAIIKLMPALLKDLPEHQGGEKILKKFNNYKNLHFMHFFTDIL